jgi:hypothetical protein
MYPWQCQPSLYSGSSAHLIILCLCKAVVIEGFIIIYQKGTTKLLLQLAKYGDFGASYLHYSPQRIDQLSNPNACTYDVRSTVGWINYLIAQYVHAHRTHIPHVILPYNCTQFIISSLHEMPHPQVETRY